VSCNKIKLLYWYLHIHDEGEEGSRLPGSTQLALPGPALPGPAPPCPALPALPGLPGTALPSPALPCPATGGEGRGAERRLGRGGGGEAKTQYYRPFILVRVTIYLAKFSYNISRGHYLPCNTYCLFLACIKAIFHIRPLRF
jgi:hypothetical protein